MRFIPIFCEHQPGVIVGYKRDDMKIHLDSASGMDYGKFIAIRKLPQYKIVGSEAQIPDEYAHLLGTITERPSVQYNPSGGLFDYQRDITELACQKKKYAVFADCGLGKTRIILDFARHAAEATGKRTLIVSPLMVARQTAGEARKWNGIDCEILRGTRLREWSNGEGTEIGITNYEAITDAFTHQLGSIILDESSMLKSHYGKWGTRLIEMGRGVEYKLCATGTPAPNDRIEYANHAVFLDRAKTVNEFLATYFVNRGQTNNRWELKPHALRPFYRSLADWSIFLTSPATYGWQDNVGTLPPISIHVDHIPLTKEQRKAAQDLTGNLMTVRVGGIGQRGKLSQIAKGTNGIPTNKPAFIRDMIASWPDESTIVWCHYNQEQEMMANELPNNVSVSGSTKEERRHEMVSDFISGIVPTLITKPKILGFGLNLQVATRQVFSGIKDSYEEFYQAVKRSNRIGSTHPLNVHIPVTELEVPFVENVLAKASRVEADTKEQEELFKEMFEHGSFA